MDRELAKELATIRNMIQDVGRKVDNYLNNRVDVVEDDVSDTQLGLAETYETTVATADDLTETQLALAEVYELVIGG